MTNFWVSWTYFIVPPPVKKFNFPMVITFEAFILEIQFLVHMITLLKMIKFNITCHFKMYCIPFFTLLQIWSNLSHTEQNFDITFCSNGSGSRGWGAKTFEMFVRKSWALVGFIDSMSWRYLRHLQTMATTIQKIQGFNKNAYNFWKLCTILIKCWFQWYLTCHFPTFCWSTTFRYTVWNIFFLLLLLQTLLSKISSCLVQLQIVLSIK